MKLYTKTGDDGSTGLVGGRRVDKDSARVDACGAIDAVNSAVGLAATCRHEPLSAVLASVQNQLFELGADLMTPLPPGRPSGPDHGAQRIGSAKIHQLEQTIDRVCEGLPPLQSFILPGGSELAAILHVARTNCRLAERRVVALTRSQTVHRDVMIYLNRLGDLLFATARWANQLEGVEDVPWVSDPVQDNHN